MCKGWMTGEINFPMVEGHGGEEEIQKVPGLVEGSLVCLASSDQAEKVPEWS